MNRIPTSESAAANTPSEHPPPNQSALGRRPRRGRGIAAAGNAHGGLSVAGRPASKPAPNNQDALASFAPDLILSTTRCRFEARKRCGCRIAQPRYALHLRLRTSERSGHPGVETGRVDYVLKRTARGWCRQSSARLRDVDDRDAGAGRNASSKRAKALSLCHAFFIRRAYGAGCTGWPLARGQSRPVDIVGYSESELLATDVQSITYPDDRDADAAQVRRMLARRSIPIRPTSAMSARTGAWCGRS